MKSYTLFAARWSEVFGSAIVEHEKGREEGCTRHEGGWGQGRQGEGYAMRHLPREMFHQCLQDLVQCTVVRRKEGCCTQKGSSHETQGRQEGAACRRCSCAEVRCRPEKALKHPARDKSAGSA